MSPPLERSLRSGPPPLTEPDRTLLPVPPRSIVIVSPAAFTSPPLVAASSWKPAPLPTVALTSPPDVESEQSPLSGPAKTALTSPPLVCAERVFSTASTLMSPPEVRRSAGPPTRPAEMLPPEVESLTTPRPSSSLTLPPDVAASISAPILPSSISPPDVRARTAPSRSPTPMSPPDVFRSTDARLGTVTIKSTWTGGQLPKCSPIPSLYDALATTLLAFCSITRSSFWSSASASDSLPARMCSFAVTLTTESGDWDTRISPPEVDTVRWTPGWTWNDFSTTRSIFACAAAVRVAKAQPIAASRVAKCMEGGVRLITRRGREKLHKTFREARRLWGQRRDLFLVPVQGGG